MHSKNEPRQVFSKSVIGESTNALAPIKFRLAALSLHMVMLIKTLGHKV